MTNQPQRDSEKPEQGDTSPASAGSAALTDADRYALKRLPDEGWFNLTAVPYTVKNPRFRCDRLVKLGALKSRVVGAWPYLQTEWKKQPNTELNRSGGTTVPR